MRLQGAVGRLQTTLCPNSHTPKAVLQTCPDGQRAGNLERSSHEDCDLSNAYGYFYIKQATASAIRASSWHSTCIVFAPTRDDSLLGMYQGVAPDYVQTEFSARMAHTDNSEKPLHPTVYLCKTRGDNV